MSEQLVFNYNERCHLSKPLTDSGNCGKTGQFTKLSSGYDESLGTTYYDPQYIYLCSKHFFLYQKDAELLGQELYSGWVSGYALQELIYKARKKGRRK